ncbi:MAG: OmpA family protein [Candidatus Krumholzibacteriia bacterium]
MRSDSTRRVAPALVSLLFLVLVVPPAAGEVDNTSRWGVGLQSGLMKLTGGDHDYSNLDQFGTIIIEHGLSRQWTIGAALKYGYTRAGVGIRGEDAGWSTTARAPLYTEMHQPMLRTRVHLAPGSRVGPFLGLGAGATVYRVLDLTGEDPGLVLSGTTIVGRDEDGQFASLKQAVFTADVEAGVDLFLSERWALNLGARYYLLAGVDRDNVGLSSYWGPDHVDANDGMVEGFVGLTVWFGSSDRDGDGIPDRYDGCPDEPEDFDGFEDSDGCPDPDNDGDGIPDVDDECPDQPEDFDGFEDEDGCPDFDNDGDGILDVNDACPDEPEDFDGFEDEDGCPDLDNDGDGVPDTEDLCPDTRPGVTVGPDGCPETEVTAPAAPRPPLVPDVGGGLVLEGVQFVSGSAQLTPESISVLTRVADSLHERPELRIEVRGHTDSTGGAEINRDLSHKRASAVRDVLVQLGIAPRRLVAVGYGEDYPIASNETREGRAQNRRVELHRID